MRQLWLGGAGAVALWWNVFVGVGAAAVAARSWTVCKIKVAGFVGKRPEIALSCMLYRGLVAYTSFTRDHTLIGYYFPPPHLPTIPMHDRKLRIQRVAFIDQKRRGSKLFLSVIDSFAANYLQVFFSFFSLSLVFNYILYSILLIFIE